MMEVSTSMETASIGTRTSSTATITASTKTLTGDEGSSSSTDTGVSEGSSSSGGSGSGMTLTLSNIMNKKGCSPSPPMVLIEPADHQEKDDSVSNNKNTASNNNNDVDLSNHSDDLSDRADKLGMGGCKSPDLALLNKQLLIEATDSAELEILMKLINERFPTVRINFFAGRDQNNNNSDMSDHNDGKLTISTTPNENNNNRNSLNAGGFDESGGFGSGANSRRLSTSSIRTATSVDGAAGLLPLMAIERQESRDSGFWSVSKCSFESMKSLSLTDSSNNG